MNTSLHIVCPHCDTTNRVAQERLASAPVCGNCKKRLFDGHPPALTAANFDAHVNRNDIPVVVDFWAEWCGPCKMMAPQFAKAAEAMEPRVRFAKLDTEAAQDIAGRYGICSNAPAAATRSRAPRSPSSRISASAQADENPTGLPRTPLNDGAASIAPACNAPAIVRMVAALTQGMSASATTQPSASLRR